MTKKTKLEIIFFVVLFIFSAGLMWKTFRVNQSGNLEIATKVWSDFAATIPLIKSFSSGANIPPQYPLFSGPPIRYHFVFFFLVGQLEKMGVRLDWALNTLSTLGFFGLLLSIYFLTQELFKKRLVSVLSVIFFLFNGSLGFLEFFNKHPLSLNTPREILTNTNFPAFAPYDGSTLVSAFWNLNIYTNQRHLALAYACFLGFILLIYKASQKPARLNLSLTLILGILIGLFPFVHLSVFAMLEISLFIFFLIIPNLRKKLLLMAVVSVIIALPQIMYMGAGQVNSGLFHPGYLIDHLSLPNFLHYWFFNLGLASILAPIGFLLIPKDQKKIFLPFLAFFVVGNLFQFSPEMAGNHKFFNLFIIGANILAASVIYRLWKKRLWGKVLIVPVIFFMTLSGLIDLFPIKNDVYMEIKSGKNNQTEQFIINNTPKKSIFLNGNYLYDPASLAGRRIFLGWPYFSWSAGYNTAERLIILKSILQSDNLNFVCKLLAQNKIDYVEIEQPTSIEEVNVNYDFFEKNFTQIYTTNENNLSIYDVALSCPKP